MRFYNGSHAFYAGIDLHARSMFTHRGTERFLGVPRRAELRKRPAIAKAVDAWE